MLSFTRSICYIFCGNTAVVYSTSFLMGYESMSLEGSQLGHYRLTRQIGSGGMGEVYLAEDTRIARQVAVKVVRNEGTQHSNSSATQESTRLFQREMKAIALLDNSHILTLLDFGEEIINRVTITYIVMPYRAEGSLNDWLSQRAEKLSLEEISNIIQQAADALQDAHDNGIIHQDVKPSNFLIRSKKDRPNQPDLFLADFGIAKLLNVTSTASQNTRGTATYMPPEQWDGFPVTATDQYALAIMAYQLLTGRTPFQGRMEQVMRQHFTVEPTPPSRLNSQLSPAIDAVLLRALAKKPEERFASISNFSTAFQQSLHYTDLRTTLLLTPKEAFYGVMRNVTLPEKRQVSVTVPANASNGQVIHVQGQGEEYYVGGRRGPLIIILSILSGEYLDAPPSLPPQSPRQEKPEGYGNESQIFTQLIPTRTSTSKKWLRNRFVVAVLVLLLILASGGLLLYIPISNQIAADNAHNATVTAQANARSATQSFLTSTAEAFTTITPNAANIKNPYPPSDGKLILYDPLHDNSQGYGWDEHPSDSNGSSCQFGQDGYHVVETQNYIAYCSAAKLYSNFAFEVQMKITQGRCGGIIFRGDGTSTNFYIFALCQDGTYRFTVYTSTATIGDDIITTSSNSTIHSGLHQSNTVAVVANGKAFKFYINGQEVAHINDSTYSEGAIGVATSIVGGIAEVVYSNARVWVLP